jgi:hypothetical protein
MRRFHHGGFVVRPDAGIKVPKDLEGKKVGVRAYSVTTEVWSRGIFINEYDPLPYGITANRPSIEALVTYSLQQKLIPSRPQLDRVFVDIDP